MKTKFISISLTCGMILLLLSCSNINESEDNKVVEVKTLLKKQYSKLTLQVSGLTYQYKDPNLLITNIFYRDFLIDNPSTDTFTLKNNLLYISRDYQAGFWYQENTYKFHSTIDFSNSAYEIKDFTFDYYYSDEVSGSDNSDRFWDEGIKFRFINVPITVNSDSSITFTISGKETSKYINSFYLYHKDWVNENSKVIDTDSTLITFRLE